MKQIKRVLSNILFIKLINVEAAEVNRLTAQAIAITAIKDSCKQTPLLSVADVFISDKVSREVVRLFIKRIDVDDNNDDISISFK